MINDIPVSRAFDTRVVCPPFFRMTVLPQAMILTKTVEPPGEACGADVIIRINADNAVEIMFACPFSISCTGSARGSMHIIPVAVVQPAIWQKPNRSLQGLLVAIC